MKSATILKFAISAAVLVGAVAATAFTAQQHMEPRKDEQRETLSAPVIVPAAPKLKVSGNWHGFDTYNYKFVGEHGDGDTTFPLVIDGITFPDELSLAAATQPLLSDQQHANGVSCNMFCWNDEGSLMGYNPAAYAALAKGQGKPTEPARAASVVSEAASVRLMDYDGITASAAPTIAIRAAINANDRLTEFKHFPVQTWQELNTYVRKIDNEDVVIVEINGTFQVTPQEAKYVGADPKYGVSYQYPTYKRAGQVALVKRGNSWYVYKG